MYKHHEKQGSLARKPPTCVIMRSLPKTAVDPCPMGEKKAVVERREGGGKGNEQKGEWLTNSFDAFPVSGYKGRYVGRVTRTLLDIS